MKVKKGWGDMVRVEKGEDIEEESGENTRKRLKYIKDDADKI